MIPDLNDPTAALTSIFSVGGAALHTVTAVHREPTPYATTFPCEIVTCRLPGRGKVRLFCKYSTKNTTCSHGQRGGVGYEAQVYRHILQSSGVSTPAFYGSYTDQQTGATWLMLEYLRSGMRVGKIPGLRAMKLAARWIGGFHAVNEGRASAATSFLTAYDAAYYRGWPRRASRFASHLGQRFPWLETLCKRLKSEIANLAKLPQTVIHGEYYPHNIMFQAGVVRPVDWETAAIAPGEIDLATLGDGWARDINHQLELEYQRARWPAGSPADFARNLELARAYVQLRWLGDVPEWTGDMTRWKRLHAASKRLQLI